MYKIIEFPRYDLDGQSHVDIASPDGMEKVAKSNYDEEIKKKIKSIKPNKSRIWVLVNALGATPPWPQNVNGDIFPEEALTGMQEIEEAIKNPDGKRKIRYKTFQEGHVFRHHDNKDPANAMGKIELAVWNPRMKRVELVLSLDKKVAPDICEKIEKGIDDLWVSMGCKVPKDQCSYCGHWAKHRAPKFDGDPDAYCDHLRFEMGKIYPDGRQAGAINWHPRFFDLSFVMIPADKTAAVLKKLACDVKGTRYVFGKDKDSIKCGSCQTCSCAIEKIASIKRPSSVELAEKSGLIDKESQISKRIIQPILRSDYKELKEKWIDEIIPRLSQYEEDIPNDIIDDVSKYPMDDIFSTMGIMGIIPKPKEFQRIIIIKLGKPDLADSLDRSGRIFPMRDDYDVPDGYDNIFDISPRNYNEDIFSRLSGFVPKRSCFGPHLHKRILKVIMLPKPDIEKTSEDDNVGKIIKLMATIGLSYAALRYLVPTKVFPKLKQFIESHPGQAAILAGVGVGGAMGIKGALKKEPLNIGKPLDNFNETQYYKYASSSVLAAARFIGIPTLMYGTAGHMRNKRRIGYKLNAMERFVARHPGKLSVGGVLAPSVLKRMILRK